MGQYEVGQTVITSNPYGRRGHEESTVTGVARKYVTVGEGYNARKFDMETGTEFIPGGYDFVGRIYSLPGWAELVARTAAIDELRGLGVEFRYTSSRRLTSGDLAEIVRIVLARNAVNAAEDGTS